MQLASRAYYLKYRPASLSELVGQEMVKKTLLSSFQTNKLSHGYLFVGPRGTGKTSTARVLAKMVNCLAEPNKIPCNVCVSCLSITDGSNLDLIEIDAASNRGIEDIRILRERINLSPTSSSKKVYIIDEVHMLTTEAFNALLKTLEEPPSHALFILATTEGAKIPATILSRVQRLDFKLASNSELLEALEKIVKKEKIDIEEEALKLIAKKAEGSFRDGVKLLDQLSSIEGKISTEVVENTLKSASFTDTLDLLKNIFEHDTQKSLLKIQELAWGFEVKDLMLSLMDTLRNLVFIKNGLGEELVKGNLLEDRYEQLVKVSESTSNKELIKIVDILQSSFEKLKFASISSLVLEVAVVEICESLDLKEETESEPVKAISAVEPTEELTQQIEQIVPSGNDSSDILKIKEKWGFVLETVRQSNFSLEALLRSINVTECTDTTIIMEVPYSFHQRILEAPKNRDLLEGIFSDILGRSIRVSTVLGNRPTRVEDIANIEVAADDEIIKAAAEIFNSDTIN